jgi:REP element-mobilizing transposase RayT
MKNHSHHRRSIRLKGYDYTSEGGYFITLVAHERQSIFGEIIDGEMRLNDFGIIAREEWFRTAQMRPYVELFEDEIVVMPNHVHGIIWITDHPDRRGTDSHRRGTAPRAPTPYVIG